MFQCFYLVAKKTYKSIKSKFKSSKTNFSLAVTARLHIKKYYKLKLNIKILTLKPYFMIEDV